MVAARSHINNKTGNMLRPSTASTAAAPLDAAAPSPHAPALPLRMEAQPGQTLNDLESKVVSVVVVILGVTFLEHFILWEEPLATLQFGAAAALMVAALVLFERYTHRAKEEHAAPIGHEQARAQRSMFKEHHEKAEIEPGATDAGQDEPRFHVRRIELDHVLAQAIGEDTVAAQPRQEGESPGAVEGGEEVLASRGGRQVLDGRGAQRFHLRRELLARTRLFAHQDAERDAPLEARLRERGVELEGVVEGPAGLVYQHVHGPVPRLPTRLAGYQGILDRLLAKAPEERFQSARELFAMIAI